MATLEDILTFKESDPDTERIRGILRDAMAGVRWEIIAQRGELAFWESSQRAGTNNALRAEGQAHIDVVHQTLTNLLAKYNAFEAQLAAMPEPKGE